MPGGPLSRNSAGLAPAVEQVAIGASIDSRARREQLTGRRRKVGGTGGLPTLVEGVAGGLVAVELDYVIVVGILVACTQLIPRWQLSGRPRILHGPLQGHPGHVVMLGSLAPLSRTVAET